MLACVRKKTRLIFHFFFSSCYSSQLRHSSSLPSILPCQSTTDMPRDVTSTSLPLCLLFTCKSNWSHTHKHTHAHPLIIPENTFDSAASYASPASNGDTNQAPKLPSACGCGASSSWVLGCLSLPFRIKGHGPVRAQHDPHVRDTQMNMCQRHGNESRARGAWERAILIRAVIKPCQEKEAMPLLTCSHL